MTLAPTHFTLQGILLWQVMKKEDREHLLSNNPWMILLLNLIANLPDLDDKIGLHRGPVHSLFLATSSLVITGLLYQFYKKDQSETASSKLKKIRLILYGEVMWLVHIFLDMFTPLALFWPLTDQVYTVNFMLVISIFPMIILGIALLPYEVLGLTLDVKTESFLTGLKFYLTNLTVEERRQVFQAEILEIPIFDFVIHVIVAMLWILIVGKPLSHAIWNKYLKTPWYNWKHAKWKIFLVGMKANVHWEWVILMTIITFSGMILTTDSQPQKRIPLTVQDELKVTPTEFAPLHLITYERLSQLLPTAQPDVEIMHSITIVDKTNLQSLQSWLIVLTTESFQALSSELTTLYQNTNLTLDQNWTTFQDNYKNILQQNIPSENKISELDDKNGIITGKFSPAFSDKTFSFGMILSSWNQSSENQQGFSITLQMEYTIIQHQEGIYYFGVALQALGNIAVLVLFLVIPTYKSARTLKRDVNHNGTR